MVLNNRCNLTANKNKCQILFYGEQENLTTRNTKFFTKITRFLSPLCFSLCEPCGKIHSSPSSHRPKVPPSHLHIFPLFQHPKAHFRFIFPLFSSQAQLFCQIVLLFCQLFLLRCHLTQLFYHI